MQRVLIWKSAFYAAISLFAILLLVPTVTTQLPSWWSKILPSEKIRLALDLQGGMYLLLEVEAQKAVESYLEQIGGPDPGSAWSGGPPHSNPIMMRPYNLRTDQLALYKTSQHGRLLYQKGDRNTATCVSCHGTHDIKSVNDPDRRDL
jgi:cytochrome c553